MGLMLVRKMLDWIKEWRWCTDQKTVYRTAQAAMRVVEVFMVESAKLVFTVSWRW